MLSPFYFPLFTHIPTFGTPHHDNGVACALEFETDTGSKSTPSETDRALKGEGEYGDFGTVECSLFQ